MHTLKNWYAQRSGQNMTIRGQDANGQDTKVFNVRRIQPHTDVPGAMEAELAYGGTVTLLV